jgi:hypothetical protein
MIKYRYPNNFQQDSENTPVESTFKSLRQMARMDTGNKQSLGEFTKTIIQFIFNNLDADKTLIGLFRLIKFANKHRISPFLATQDYCVKVLAAHPDGKVALNISPIYHLGPEYPEYYKEKQGVDLNNDAIIGLLEIDTPDPEKPSMFNLGIDAGIAFEEAKISHNKHMNLIIQLADDGILATLHCEGQSTSKIFTWDTLGMPSATYSDLYSQKVQNIWAA